ncbi:MAG: hypothetical protein H6811_01690 [Phycisphaeraceae bacterium]|nr:hypothetical protein [Phycisphaeraceae bacterium]
MSLPDLNPADATLLARFFQARADLHALLKAPDPPDLITLLSFLARPDIAPWLDHYHNLHARALRSAAHDALARLIQAGDDPIQRRLAATALLHNLRPPRATRSAPSELQQRPREPHPRNPSLRNPRRHEAPEDTAAPLAPTVPPSPEPTPSLPELTASLHDALVALGIDPDLFDAADELHDAALDGDLAELLEDDALSGALGEDLQRAAQRGELADALEDAIDRDDNLPALAQAFRRDRSLTNDPAPGPAG